MKIKVSKLKHHPKNQEIYTLSSIEDLREEIKKIIQKNLVKDMDDVIEKFENKRLKMWDYFY